ncbi:thioredoxin-like protein [Atractiella rhizophila]|nr:thioredoxin-like protein [Atractiella rhizophila]
MQWRQTAAGLWSRIYGAYEGWSGKSALQESIERLVRKEKIVVFSKTTCPYSRKAKALLTHHSIPFTPIEVDLRPDLTLLKPLLTSLTSHSTFPNIIIAGRSIGGSDDLERSRATGELKRVLEEVGVSFTGL